MKLKRSQAADEAPRAGPGEACKACHADASGQQARGRDDVAPRLHSHCPPPERRPSKPSPDPHEQDTSLGWAGRTVGRNPSGSVTERQATLSDGTV